MVQAFQFPSVKREKRMNVHLSAGFNNSMPGHEILDIEEQVSKVDGGCADLDSWK